MSFQYRIFLFQILYFMFNFSILIKIFLSFLNCMDNVMSTFLIFFQYFFIKTIDSLKKELTIVVKFLIVFNLRLSSSLCFNSFISSFFRSISCLFNYQLIVGYSIHLPLDGCFFCTVVVANESNACFKRWVR